MRGRCTIAGICYSQTCFYVKHKITIHRTRVPFTHLLLYFFRRNFASVNRFLKYLLLNIQYCDYCLTSHRARQTRLTRLTQKGISSSFDTLYSHLIKIAGSTRRIIHGKLPRLDSADPEIYRETLWRPTC